MTTTLVPGSQLSASASRLAISTGGSLTVSSRITFGVGAARKASTAAAGPPIWIRAWTLFMRRSAATACITPATSCVSQKACKVMRGSGAMISSLLMPGSSSGVLAIICLRRRR